MEEKVISENEIAVFKEDGLFAKRYDNGFRVIIAERKDGTDKEYVLYHKGKPVYGHTSIESIFMKMDIIKLMENKK